VLQWAKTHGGSIKRGESATEWEALEKEHGDEVRAKIRRANESSKQTWDYINKYYDTIFGEKNQVKK
jgi:hypothetical protein